MNFRKDMLSLLLLVSLVPAVAGCEPISMTLLGVGAVGVVGGYAVSPDTVEGQVSRSMEEVYDVAREITGIMGQISQEAPNANQIVAMINSARVTVTLTAVSVSTTKVAIKARKAFMPKIDIAQDVYAKIVNGLEN